jgi:hypothetical protein
MVHVVTIRYLRRAAMAAAIVRNDAEPFADEEQQLRIPIIG